MAPRSRSSSQEVGGRERWLHADEPARSRPWAYEQVLLGSNDRAQRRELGAVAEELDDERTELARLYRELDERLVRISSLERRLHELTPATEGEKPHPPSRTLPHTRAASADKDDSRAISADRSYSLARCEGFEVDSPTGLVGFVEGLRFISRIDQPDLLEVRGGRFGRRLFLIPIQQVEEVRITEERVLVRGAPTQNGDLLGELAGRFRRVLHVGQTAS